MATQSHGIVVSIKPLHALVQGVMGDTGKADLLMRQNASPHGYSLRPSQLQLLQKARAVFYIDDAFEPFLRNALKNLPSTVTVVEIAHQPGMEILPLRKSSDWDNHDHAEHGHQETSARSENDHGHEGDDLHIWLDTDNARTIVQIIARRLSEINPDNASIYQVNAKRLLDRIEILDKELAVLLQPVKDKPYIVLHDAYQYFDHQQGLNGVGSITIEPNQPQSIKDVQAIRKKLQDEKVVCVFREPQFSDRLIETVIEGSSVRIGTLDPIGAALEENPDLYFLLMQELAGNFAACLDEDRN
ncbi:zinc ABC transporter substrate-binding protein [Sneathiella marina]|uniref:High-affinity zinc uptake system protein ZnuA n=1 Tax=Sneathiella marina TaxID=2950108 RepID=A0ABY4W2R8_9PROT|nr:zinc ABC transporter substrate-binding protein [Sneathiella marina]USG61490.1 zinc ABC transporter substrate-binding protein [Sneathiella marina]